MGTEVIASQKQLDEKKELLSKEKEQILDDLKNDASINGVIDLSPFDFGDIHVGDAFLAKAYEIASIFNIKYDSANGSPSIEKLKGDLKQFLDVYKRCRTIYGSRKSIPNC